MPGLFGGDTDNPYAEQQGKISKKLYKTWEEYYRPMELKLLEELQRPVEEQPGFLRSMAMIDRNFANTAANLRRTMAGRYPSGSGLETEVQKNLELQRPQSKAQNYTVQSQQQLANLMNMMSGGRSLTGQAVSGLGSAASSYANMAGMNAQAQAALFGSLGEMGGNMYGASQMPEASEIALLLAAA